MAEKKNYCFLKSNSINIKLYTHPHLRQLVQFEHSQLSPPYTKPNQVIFKPQTNGLMVPRENIKTFQFRDKVHNLIVYEEYLHFFPILSVFSEDMPDRL